MKSRYRKFWAVSVSISVSMLVLVASVNVIANPKIDAHLVAPAQLQWVRDAAVGDLNSRLQQQLTRHPDASNRVIEWRMDTVTDFRGQTVPASSERLLRWDRRHPDLIFSQGFRPRSTAAWISSEMDLHDFVNRNVESIFTSTSRTVQREVSGAARVQIWTPRDIRNSFQYEIYAPGGIEVGLSLGTANRFPNQNEVAFPGGILPRYIRTAREFDSDGRLVRIWANGGFTNPNLASLPNPICGPSVPVKTWTGPEDRTITVLNDPLADQGDKQFRDGAMVTSFSVVAFTDLNSCEKAIHPR